MEVLDWIAQINWLGLAGLAGAFVGLCVLATLGIRLIEGPSGRRVREPELPDSP